VDLDQQASNIRKIAITKCFYEYPAALAEIDFWESLVKKQVVLKIVNDGNLLFVLDKKLSNNYYEHELEAMVCIPLGTSIENVDMITNKTENIFGQMFAGEKEFFDYKTLVFGQVCKRDLEHILLTLGDK